MTVLHHALCGDDFDQTPVSIIFRGKYFFGMWVMQHRWPAAHAPAGPTKKRHPRLPRDFIRHNRGFHQRGQSENGNNTKTSAIVSERSARAVIRTRYVRTLSYLFLA